MESINPLITILAIKESLKLIGRIECSFKKESNFFIEKMKFFSLYYKVVNKSDYVKSEKVKMHIYFSKNKKNKEKINKLIKLYQRVNYDNEMFANANKEIGRIYGYPDCCIDWFVDFLISWLAKNRENNINLIEPSQDLINLKFLANSKGNSFNKVVNFCQNDSPLFHLPHSLNCKKSINIGRENLKILKEYNKELFLKYQEYLKGTFRVYKNRIVKIGHYSKLGKKDNIIYFK